MAKNDGNSSAFPTTWQIENGMTRRQWLSGLAMQGILSSGMWKELQEAADAEKVPLPNGIAAMALVQADAMLAEEAKEE